MATYVRAPGSDSWHWCKNCSHYPSKIAKQQSNRPSWDLCEQCRAMEKTGTCRQ